MGLMMASGALTVVEPVVIPDVFVTHLVRTEKIGPTTRLVLAVPHDHTLVVTAKIILPDSALQDIAEQLMGLIHSLKS